MSRTKTVFPHETPGIVHPTERDWEETLAATSGVLVVDFWAPWCDPCRAMAPVLEDLVRTSVGTVTLAMVNVDEQPGLAVRFGIQSIPTLLFVKDGRIVEKVVGAVPRVELQRRLDTLRRGRNEGEPEQNGRGHEAAGSHGEGTSREGGHGGA
jgi:thioredoxin